MCLHRYSQSFHLVCAHAPIVVSLHRIIAQIIAPTVSRDAVNELVHTCYKMSLAYLHHRLRRGSLVDHQFGISNEDLALDCIAELFQRDDAGRFPVLEQYFEPLRWEALTEEALQIALRRLVFSKVNENLFRSYREEDPNLAKIIRNIKEAVKHEQGVSLVRHQESSWVVAGSPDTPVDGNPLAPPEILESHLLSVLCSTSNTYTAVASFAAFVEEHPYYCNGYPLSAFARALRTAFAGRRVLEDEKVPVFEPVEVESAIQRAVSYVRAALHETYVRGGKLSQRLFETYLSAVKTVLQATFTLTEEHVESQYDALSTLLPGLSKDAYMAEHRNILQYLFKLSRSRMVYYLQDEA